MAVNAVIRKGNITTLTEHKTSPRYEFSSRNTCTKILEGVLAVCLSTAPARGTFGTGDQAGYRVERSTVEPLGNGFGRLTIIYEAGGDGASDSLLPADEYSAEPFEVNPAVEKHPNFTAITQDTLIKINSVRDSAIGTERVTAKDEINAAGPASAIKLLALKLKGVESFYLAGIKYTWTKHYWTIPAMTFGGYINAPSGPLAAYFTSGLSWLRQSDSLSFDGTKYRLTRSWIGGPSGHWDTDLYGA